MAEPFREAPSGPSPLVDRLLRREGRRRASVELENLLARAPRVSEVSAEDVQEVVAACGGVRGRAFRDAARRLYRAYLEHCLRDHVLSPEEIAELAHLRAILGLVDADIEAVRDEVGRGVYGKAVDQVLADRRLDPEERRFLEHLERELRLPEEIAARLRAEAAKRIWFHHVDAALESRRLSRDEELELEALARDLNVTLDVDQRTRALLDKYRLYWLIENGDVPELEVAVDLERDERCYFGTEIEWHEPRPVTRRIHHRGPSVRSVGGRVDDLGVERSTEDLLLRVDGGLLYLTNRRLIFAGEKKEETIPLAAIDDATAYRNGIEIETREGSRAFLVFERDVDLLAMLLARALRDVGTSRADAAGTGAGGPASGRGT